MNGEYILKSSYCDSCIWGEQGFYNPICCHCPNITFGKRDKPSFMQREEAESKGFVLPRENSVKDNEVTE